MKSRDELPSIFADFHKLVRNKFDANIKVLRSDNRGKYTSNVCKELNLKHLTPTLLNRMV